MGTPGSCGAGLLRLSSDEMSVLSAFCGFLRIRVQRNSAKYVSKRTPLDILSSKMVDENFEEWSHSFKHNLKALK